MADEITNRSFSKYSPFFSNFPSARVKSRATLGFSAMTSVLPICKVRFVRFPNSDRDSKGQPLYVATHLLSQPDRTRRKAGLIFLLIVAEEPLSKDLHKKRAR